MPIDRSDILNNRYKLLNDRYRIEKIIGEGTYSTVYKGWDIKTNSFVAIKSVKKSNDILNEIRILKATNYEHLVAAKDIVELNGIIYIIFELCDFNLITFVNEFEYSNKNMLRIMRMILLGTKELHDLNILHRDLKMSNVLIRDDLVKICDFGLACFSDENDMKFCGTVDYIAPEMIKMQAAKENSRFIYTNKIDIYSIGVIFKILACRSKSISIKNSTISDQLKVFINNFLIENPKQRPSAACALQNDIFNSLFEEIINFGRIKEFSKDTKYGFIEKSGNFIFIKFLTDSCKMTNESGSKDSVTVIKIEQKSNCYSCNNPFCTDFSSIIKVNDKITQKHFLTNTQLKFYNYLCIYLQLLADKTEINKIANPEYEFTLFLSKNWEYKSKDITVKNNYNKYLINGKEYTVFPQNLLKLHSYIQVLFNRSLKSCKPGDFSVGNKESLILSIKKESFREKEVFLEGKGWLIKNKLTYTCYLNNGKKIGVNINNKFITIEGELISVRNEVDKKYFEILKTVKLLFEEYRKVFLF
ncbi:hypothetical protein NUSPORA_01065 [Nucleospora cyclopteri]